MNRKTVKRRKKQLKKATVIITAMSALLLLDGEQDVVCVSSDERCLLFHTSLLQAKTSRSTQGVAVMALKARKTLTGAALLADSTIRNQSRYRVRSLPAAGAVPFLGEADLVAAV